MAKFNKQKLERLLSQEKWDKAGNMISSFLAADDDGSEAQARAKAALALVYLDVMTRINEAYTASLNEAIGQIKDLKEMARIAKEGAERKRVEETIGKMQG